MFGKIGCLVGSTTPGISLQLRQYVKNVDDRSTVPMVPDFYFAHGYLQQKLFFSRSICYSTKVYIYLNSMWQQRRISHMAIFNRSFFFTTHLLQYKSIYLLSCASSTVSVHCCIALGCCVIYIYIYKK
jgi:hypothetical protein